MTAPLPSAEEQAVIDRFEAAPDAEESLRARVARALHFSDAGEWMGPAHWAEVSEEMQAVYRRRAVAAIAAMRGES